ncbi:toll/interleukin-1 receptor domain-containing protein [Thauera sinica]|uniref:Toll/interleukin-1 receptor domain-containing protein n=1 Tax=Thauera sinica TaxID=2665146 RepID=A0ABW1ASE2_9RHOO|nr:toll/interleukin-1 receptor domain-containing protein [Thauera sp. K11]ATE61407.1 hypothetical protein CCZ27_16920 [Thauera sp. K11]
MKVFLSWSGDASREIATLLHEHLPRLLAGVEPFLSEHDIPSGTDWAKVLAAKLRESRFAIVCLSPDNVDSAWLLYEAGALTNHKAQRLCALLIGGLRKEDVPKPLSRFQHRAFSEAEFARLVKDIGGMLEPPPAAAQVDQALSAAWPQIQARYAEIHARHRLTPRPRKVETTFTRTVLRLPLADALLEALGAAVEGIRRQCVEHVRALSPGCGIRNDRVRANVFLPDYHVKGNAGHGFRLFMEPRLRRQMDRPEEFSIRFAPGQGVTATVFDECQQRIIGVREFELTDELRNVIHPDLKWIISTPVMSRDGTALGVLNIDILACELDKETVLEPLGDLIVRELESVQRRLDDQPRTLIRIEYGEL